MMKFGKFAAGLAAAMCLTNTPAIAIESDADAQKVRQLNYMLMTSSLRCRFGEDDFQRDYVAFTSTHVRTIDAAGQRLKSGLVARYGARGGTRAFDRMNTSMANTYGSGHPWMECNELKQVTRDLAADRSEANLLQAADWLLSSDPGQSPYRVARR